MAEGIVSSHSLLVASQNVQPSQLVSELPAVAVNSVNRSSAHNEEMKIAWRYQNMRVIDTSPTGGQTFGHYYDLSKTMDKEVLESASIKYWDGESLRYGAESFENKAYSDLLKTVHQTMKDGQFLISDEPEKRNVLRIAIHSLGSRLWHSEREEKTSGDLLKFFYCLKSLLRNAYAVAVVTVPARHLENSVNCCLNGVASYFLAVAMMVIRFITLSGRVG